MRDLVRRVRLRLAGILRRCVAARQPGAAPASEAGAPPVPVLADALRDAGLSFAEWFAGSGARLHTTPSPGRLDILLARRPEQAADTLRRADAILGHRFDLLGSGPYCPRDPDRPAAPDGYQPIDWALDPTSGARFPRGIPKAEWNFDGLRPPGADIKYPWELARCQHWPLLGQAWRIGRNPSHALEIAAELRDFMQANPVGIGVNWLCTMDVALRALNWAIALELIRDCDALDAAFQETAHAALFDHAVFIFANLENHYEVTSNHFLSNVVGLHFLACVFADLGPGREWNDFCRRSLETEILVQVLPDGADFESSVPYHRLVVELFLASARLAEHCDAPLSAAYRARLADMVRFLAGVLRPDGLMPQIGDADDGRVHILSSYGTWLPQDARHVFAPAAMLLDEPAWLKHAGPDGCWEAAWWGYDLDPARLADGPPPDHAALYRDAGIAVARAGGNYLAVTNAIVGTKGFGNHKHNDQLGFEYHTNGVAFIVDPGSYAYTGNPDARNRFRGTRSHNTLQVDDVEQNDIRPEWLFRMFETAHAVHVTHESTGDEVRYVGRHTGYTRLPEPVTHEREFRYRPSTGELRICDRLTGRGMHDLRWHFHLAPGVTADAEERRARLANGGTSCTLLFPPGLRATVLEAEYSPSYGVRRACLAIELHARAQLAGEAAYPFELLPGARGGR